MVLDGENNMKNIYYFFWNIKSEDDYLQEMITVKKFDDIVQKPRIFVTELMFHLKLFITQFGTDM